MSPRHREAEESVWPVTKKRIRIVEKEGLKLSQILTKSYPWNEQPCGRIKCILCKQNPEGSNK